MGVAAYFHELEKVPEDELDVQDQIRYHCWKIIHLRNAALKKIDEAFFICFSASAPIRKSKRTMSRMLPF